MANKAEIGWNRETEAGVKLQVFARRFGGEWQFFVRQKRYDVWQRVKDPLLEDWLELLDAVQRRITRRLLRPEEEERVKNAIRSSYPEAEL